MYLLKVCSMDAADPADAAEQKSRTGAGVKAETRQEKRENPI